MRSWRRVSEGNFRAYSSRHINSQNLSSCKLLFIACQQNIQLHFYKEAIYLERRMKQQAFHYYYFYFILTILNWSFFDSKITHIPTFFDTQKNMKDSESVIPSFYMNHLQCRGLTGSIKKFKSVSRTAKIVYQFHSKCKYFCSVNCIYSPLQCWTFTLTAALVCSCSVFSYAAYIYKGSSSVKKTLFFYSCSPTPYSIRSAWSKVGQWWT